MTNIRKAALTRRDFGLNLTAGAGMLTTGMLSTLMSSPARAKLPNVGPGLKLGINLTGGGGGAPPEPTAELLLFLKQIDCKYVMFYGLPQDARSLEGLTKRVKAFADGGVTLYAAGISTPPPEVMYNLPGRDKKLEEMKDWIRLLGKAGVPYILSAWFEGVWQSGVANVREGETRDFDESALQSLGARKNFKFNDLLQAREYSYNEMFDNWAYMCKHLGPVAEDAGVFIGYHTPDPPGYEKMGGIAQVLYNFDAIKKAMAVTNSPNLGFVLDTGIWTEGGSRMGISLTDAIKYFVGQKKVMEVHFRNVSGSVPHFHEAYMDNGVLDMYAPMKALLDSGYTGVVHQDHTPKGWVGGPYTYEAYSMAYMRALLQRAQREKS